MLNTDMITHNRLTELLNYDPNTGVFTWKVARGNRPDLQPGSIAGNFNIEKGRNYCRITVDDKAYKAHRLAWFYMTQEWPKNPIDHIKGDGSDNRWKNLRLSTHSQNQWNSKRRTDNVSGYKGVSYKKDNGKWYYTIQTNKKRKFGGYYSSPELAYIALCEYRKDVHGAFVNHG